MLKVYYSILLVITLLLNGFHISFFMYRHPQAEYTRSSMTHRIIALASQDQKEKYTKKKRNTKTY